MILERYKILNDHFIKLNCYFYEAYFLVKSVSWKKGVLKIKKITLSDKDDATDYIEIKNVSKVTWEIIPDPIDNDLVVGRGATITHIDIQRSYMFGDLVYSIVIEGYSFRMKITINELEEPIIKTSMDNVVFSVSTQNSPDAALHP